MKNEKNSDETLGQYKYFDEYQGIYILVYCWRNNQLSDKDFNELLEERNFNDNALDYALNTFNKDTKNQNETFNLYQIVFLLTALMKTNRLSKDDFCKITENLIDEKHMKSI